MIRHRTRLLASAAGAGLIACSAGVAEAFTSVDWDWDLDVRTIVQQRIATDIVLEPTGLAAVEGLQIQIGDVTAISRIVPGDPGDPGNGDDPDDPDDPYDPGPMDDLSNAISNVVFYYFVDGELQELKLDYAGSETKDPLQPLDVIDELEAHYGIDIVGYTIKSGQVFTNVGEIPDGATPTDQSGVDVELSFNTDTGDIANGVTIPTSGAETGQVNAPIQQQQEPQPLVPLVEIVPEADLSGAFAVVNNPGAAIPRSALDELPEVLSEAVAVGNNAAIEATVKTDLHFAQILADVADGRRRLPGLGKAQIRALSEVSGVLNASVGSAATAVGNTVSVDLAASTPDDGFLVGDFLQLSLADVTAVSRVSNVSVNGYTDLGRMGRALVDSAATAVGNTLSISVANGPAGAQ